MRKKRCESPGCRREAAGIWTNWGQGMKVRTCAQHRYPVRSGPLECWRWVRNPQFKYGRWVKAND